MAMGTTPARGLPDLAKPGLNGRALTPCNTAFRSVRRPPRIPTAAIAPILLVVLVSLSPDAVRCLLVCRHCAWSHADTEYTDTRNGAFRAGCHVALSELHKVKHISELACADMANPAPSATHARSLLRSRRRMGPRAFSVPQLRSVAAPRPFPAQPWSVAVPPLLLRYSKALALEPI